jgi:hypothetical protein
MNSLFGYSLDSTTMQFAVRLSLVLLAISKGARCLPSSASVGGALDIKVAASTAAYAVQGAPNSTDHGFVNAYDAQDRHLGRFDVAEFFNASQKITSYEHEQCWALTVDQLKTGACT